MAEFSCIEICAGAGGQALGLERAGFKPLALIDNDSWCCRTLKINRREWNVIEDELDGFHANGFTDVDLFAGGVPCPPFSLAGQQLGSDDDRDLFPVALRLIDECKPKTVMLENVRGLLGKAFDSYRSSLKRRLEQLGYWVDIDLLNASDYGVSQLRPRVVIVGLRLDLVSCCTWGWPSAHPDPTPSVGDLLFDLMASRGWEGAERWREKARDIAPTLVGGSKKHGGADLGPTRAKRAWAALGVDGLGLADQPPEPGFAGMPRLTNSMAARIQGFPDDWKFEGGKTAVYRQIGNAFPPPVAAAVASQIAAFLDRASVKRKAG